MRGSLDAPCPPELGAKLREVAHGAASRGRKLGKAVEEDLVGLAMDLYLAQGGRCALTGLPFKLEIIGSGQARRPFAPSLDRVDSGGGYTRDNVRLVCQAVNFALNSFGEDVFFEIVSAASEFDSTAVKPLPAVAEDQAARAREQENKRRYIRHIVREAPAILASRGGSLEKSEMRASLRQSFARELPMDEANAYGWGFRRLTEAGVIEPASGQSSYRLRQAST